MLTVVALLAGGPIACSKKEGIGERAGKALDEAAGEMKKTGEEIKDGAEQAGEAIKDGAEKAGDAIKEGAEEAENAIREAND